MKGLKRKQSVRIGNVKKHKSSKNEENIATNSINMMEEAFLRFPHIPEQIFKKLDNKSLTNSRVVGMSWQIFIDERDYSWIRIKDVISGLNEECENDETVFHLVCRKGLAKIAEKIMENSVELNIGLNACALDNNYSTAFHLACNDGQTTIAEIIMKKSAEKNINLTQPNIRGESAFHLACKNGQSKIVEIFMQNSAQLNIDLNAENNYGYAGFHLACYHGKYEVAEV